MRIAVLVIAHEDADHLNALVTHLAASFDVYVHLDRKGDMKTLDVSRGERIHVISRRRVHWGSYGMIQATLDLMTLAVRSQADRYLLISGRDIPLLSNGSIDAFFRERTDREFIECARLPLPADAGEHGWLDRVSWFYSPSERGIPGLRGRLLGRARSVSYRLNSGLRVSRPTRGLEFYGGSNWWNLTHDAVQGVVDLVDREPRYLRRFRMTGSADEIFVQTALMAIGFGDRVESTSLRFVDWTTGPEFPRTLRTEDHTRIRESGMLFARKVDARVDAGIVRLLWADLRQDATGVTT